MLALRQSERTLAAIAAIERELTRVQRKLLRTPARFKAIHPGRRGGKSEALGRAATIFALCAPSRAPVVLGADTREKAQGLYWALLQEINYRHQLGAEFKVGDLRAVFPGGGEVMLWGANDAKQVQRARGYKPVAALFDEVASYTPLLRSLVTDVLEPALGDYGGALWLAGTPGVVRSGYWFDVCTGKIPGWSVHHWTVRDNEHFPRDPDEYLREVLARNQWTEDEPVFRREYLGEWVHDDGALVYRYHPDRNDVDALPADYDPQRWVHTVAVDFGMSEECAWGVLASHPHRRDIYMVHASKEKGLLPSEAAERTAELCSRYSVDVLVGDQGGLGKPYVEEYNRRFAEKMGRAMLPAEKSDKRGTIDLANGDLRSGRVKIVAPFCQPFSDEALSLPWNEARTEEDKRFPNHCCDTFLYSWRHHTAYCNSAPEKRLDPRKNPDYYERWLDEQDRIRAQREAAIPDWER